MSESGTSTGEVVWAKKGGRWWPGIKLNDDEQTETDIPSPLFQETSEIEAKDLTAKLKSEMAEEKQEVVCEVATGTQIKLDCKTPEKSEAAERFSEDTPSSQRLNLFILQGSPRFCAEEMENTLEWVADSLSESDGVDVPAQELQIEILSSTQSTYDQLPNSKAGKTEPSRTENVEKAAVKMGGISIPVYAAPSGFEPQDSNVRLKIEKQERVPERTSDTVASVVQKELKNEKREMLEEDTAFAPVPRSSGFPTSFKTKPVANPALSVDDIHAAITQVVKLAAANQSKEKTVEPTKPFGRSLPQGTFGKVAMTAIANSVGKPTPNKKGKKRNPINDEALSASAKAPTSSVLQAAVPCSSNFNEASVRKTEKRPLKSQKKSLTGTQTSCNAKNTKSSTSTKSSSTGAKGEMKPALVAQRVVHMVPIENEDGTLTALIISFENGTDQSEADQRMMGEGRVKQVLRVDRVELPNGEKLLHPHEKEAAFLDEDVADPARLVAAFMEAPKSKDGKATQVPLTIGDLRKEYEELITMTDGIPIQIDEMGRVVDNQTRKTKMNQQQMERLVYLHLTHFNPAIN